MSKFATRLKKFNISDRTAFVSIDEIGEGARIEVKSTSSFNKPYFNALLAVGTKAIKKKSSDVLTVAEIRKDRKQQAELFKSHVIVDWVNVVDDEGAPVEFSEENLAELMAAILKDAPELFDRIRDVADDNREFYEEDEVPDEDVEEFVGNSESGSSGS